MERAVVRWGIVGCGAVTEVKSGPAYHITTGFTLDAVMRRTAEKAKDYAKRHGVARWYSDAAELIDDPDIDAVYIATPPASHCELALRVAAAGKPCCVEKPMANTVEECERMNAAFEAAGCPLFVAYYRRSLPRFERVVKWLSEGAIGDVQHVSWRLVRPPSMRDLAGGVNWRTDPVQAPGGYFDDLASHGLDLLDFLLGPIHSPLGHALNQRGLYGAVDAVTATWRHRKTITGSGAWHFGGASSEDEVVIYGSLGQIRFAVFGEQPVVLEAACRRESPLIENPDTIQLPHVQNMARALLGEAGHPSTGVSAIRTARVMASLVGSPS